MIGPGPAWQFCSCQRTILLTTRSLNQVSTASEFIFSSPEKVSIRILVTTHQPLDIHPQELNTEDLVFAAQSGGSAAL
jgi:hypothetical protein